MLRDNDQQKLQLSPYQGLYDMIVPQNHLLRKIMWRSIVKKLNAAAGGTDEFPVITGLTAHVFRHKYCTNLCYQVPKISLRKIAELLGDTQKMVMDVYNHVMEEKENVVDTVASAAAF